MPKRWSGGARRRAEQSQPRARRGGNDGAEFRGRGGGHHNVLEPREIFVAAASAAATRAPLSKPRAERGAKIVQRAFARG